MKIGNKYWQEYSTTKGIILGSNSTIQDAGKKFQESKATTLFIVDDGVLIGTYSKGDFIRQTTDSQNPNTKIIINKNFLYLKKRQSPDRYLKAKDVNYVNSLPVIDDDNNLIKVIRAVSEPCLTIGEATYKPYVNPMIIAEIGNNHCGKIEKALYLVDEAKSNGADAIKLQARDLKEIYIDLSKEYLMKCDFGAAYTAKELIEYNLEFNEICKILDHAKSIGLKTICTPFDNTSLEKLIKYKPDAIKIASADMSNPRFRPYLEHANIPILMSTGMSTLEDIKEVSKWGKYNYLDITFLHTNSTYPTAYKDINLNFMRQLIKLSPTGLVGYSGHELGIHIPTIAASMGACIIEKHLTYDKSERGNDHKVSLIPDELLVLKRSIDETLQALGSIDCLEREISQGEALNLVSLSKGCYLRKDKNAGDEVLEKDLKYCSPCVGIKPQEFQRLDSKVLSRSIKKDSPLLLSHFDNDNKKPDTRNLGLFGIPVRMSDLSECDEIFQPKFMEYHIFATDLEIDVTRHSDQLIDKRFIYHAPEQYIDGFVLDLVSKDEEIVKRSKKELQKCIDWILILHEASGNPEKPSVILNCGGHTTDINEIHKLDKKRAFEELAKTLEKYEKEGIKILPQTMPPLPWFYGGQAYHRLFVDLNEIIEFQAYKKNYFCLDVSHSFLACKNLDKDFYYLVEEVNQYIKHCHISDGRQPNGEGLQVGEGDIEFQKVIKILSLKDGNKSWIPEIWNGHLNNFSGFKCAIERINQLMANEAKRDDKRV